MKQEDSNITSLVAPYKLEYAYKRSLGPILSEFFTGLLNKRILGVRMSDGGVMVPPAEYDPRTGESLGELIAVSDSGVVESWSWNGCPESGNVEFEGWALIRLLGSTTGLLHRIRSSSQDKIFRGAVVKAIWAAQRHGMITDLEAFVPEDDHV
ncbi:MAG: DNA-binding protein [Myxococcota bacterium]|nr:DNA-binding protein [Myxococcota bacterium]